MRLWDLMELGKVPYLKLLWGVTIMMLLLVVLNITIKNAMVIIPQVSLEDAFPYFNTLSITEKCTILKTLPYFEDELVLGDILINRCNPTQNVKYRDYNSVNEVTYNEAENKYTITYGATTDTGSWMRFGQTVESKPASDREKYFYNRAEIKFVSSEHTTETTRFRKLYGNEIYILLAGKDDSYTPLVSYTEFTRSSYLCMTEDYSSATPSFVYYGISIPPVGELDGSTLYLKDIMCIDLRTSGWYTYFKLVGASDQEIYNWCESLPAFIDEYNPVFHTLTITAIAGDYTDSVILSKVQDGADGR